MVVSTAAVAPWEGDMIRRESLQERSIANPKARGAVLAALPTPPQGEELEMFQLELQPSQPHSIAFSFPEGGHKAWLVVFSGFCLIAATFGLGACIGIFQSHWQSHQLSNYTSRDVGWISSTQVFLTLFLGVQVGPLFDRYGPRWLTFVGSVGCVAYLLILGECTQYWHFFLCFGVLGGVSCAILTTVALSTVSHWFKARRGLATGVAFMGTSLGGIVFPLALSPILQHLSWAWAMRLLGLVVLVLVVLGNLFIRGRLPTAKQSGGISLRCFQDSRFAWATVGISCTSNRKMLLEIRCPLTGVYQVSSLCSIPPLASFPLTPLIKALAIRRALM